MSCSSIYQELLLKGICTTVLLGGTDETGLQALLFGQHLFEALSIAETE